ncbi:MAG: DUF3179 domain-containing (seleno)protein [Arthrobacter oryzae]
MELLPLAFLAGILTVLSPCVLPLLPVVLAGSAAEENRRAPYIIIASLAVSVVLFTLLIKATTVLLGVPSNVWLIISGALVAFIGASLAFPRIWDRLAEGLKLHEASGRLSAGTATRTGTSRNVLLGFSLGPAFTSCSPTYGLILAVVLPANFTVGLSNLAAYTVGLAAVLLLVALGGRKVTKRLGWATNPNGRFRRGLGVFLVLVGLLIASGQIRTIETWLIDRGFLGTVALERGFIDSAQGQQGTGSTGSTDGGGTDVANVPNFLRQSFPTTDFSRADPAIANVLSGGPAKDGIPALDNPAFVPVSEFTRPDSVQALLLEGSTEIKAYPYNILVWHEIVNDTIDGEPVAVTFCPLCGSAIVYEGVLPGGEATTFGVSGALLESNLVMFDRSTETLWQQSTGKALAGTHFGQQLALHKFQLLSVGEIKAQHPSATILSENTGHRRDYASNPYGGYDQDDRFIFRPSFNDPRYFAKDIFVAFTVDGTPAAAPWLALENGRSYTTDVGGKTVTLTKADSNLEITGPDNTTIPFYFEMWFSWAVQHQDAGVVYDPRTG